MAAPSMSEALDRLVDRYGELKTRMESGQIDYASRDGQRLQREFARLTDVVNRYVRMQEIQKKVSEAKQILDSESDEELVELAELEVSSLQEELETISYQLKLDLVPPDPNSGKNVILEIRGAAGGEEGNLFASDLLRMYSNFVRERGWRMETLEMQETGNGGIKEAIVSIAGDDAYDLLHLETGAHRVQRVPATESSGRIHTSTATVIAMSEAEEVEIDIDENELRIDVFRSSGPGGQSVNTTDSAVRITHVPTGLVVSCQNEKSQHKNKAAALRVLRTRLQQMEREKEESARAAERKAKVGSGERSDKIRTYNYPDSRVTDHRINFKTNDLQGVLNGAIDEMLSSLWEAEREARLSEVLESTGVDHAADQ